MTIQAGDRFGRYEIRGILGAGGMGEVFRAHDSRLGREVAIKRIGGDWQFHADAAARFEQEARAASALNHPNIVAIYDIGEEQGQPFIVMELLEGESLRSLLNKRVPLDLALRLALQIAGALAAAHERGILHRDLKPENIFVTRSGTAKILDFGLARICQPESVETAQDMTVERLTQSGRVLGTLGYSAPEILSGGSADARADIFSFGVVLYEMVCGRHAFRGKTAADTLASTLRDEPPSPTRFCADLPSPVAKLIERCLRKHPANRYESSRQLCDELRQTVEARVESAQPARRRAPLPAPRTALIGRERELEAIRALIAGDHARIVTLTGAGGSGKTRLALGVAAELQDHFRGEIFFVPLATISDPAAVVAAIARGMQITVGTSDSPLAAIATEINATGSRALLILDNFEQVMAAAADVSDLVAACPAVSVLITSRELLRLYGEHDVAVLPLAVPDPQVHRTAAMVATVPSVSLFLGRVKASDPAFTLRDGDVEAVAEICRRLDGLPLALELAAARVRMMPPLALLARMDQSLQLLTSGARDAPDRQLTLRRTIDWSYGLLAPAEQTLFRRLSVFAGGFTLEAAEAIADPFGKLGSDLVDGVASLVDKSLLQRYDADGNERRFFMLQTIREYAASLLRESEDDQHTRRAHAAYLLVLGEESARSLAGVESPDWLARLAREHDNFRAALDWLLATRNAAWGLRLALALFYFWERADHLAEGRRRLGALLEIAGEDTDDALRARALHALGIFAAALRDHTEAVLRTEMSLALYKRLGDHNGVAIAHNALGIQFTELEDYGRAARHLEDALTAWEKVANPSGYARSLSNLAFVRRKQGLYDEARQLHEDSAARFEELGDHLSSAWARNHQGDIARDQRLWADATAHYRTALEMFRSLKDDWGVASSIADLGTVASCQGDTTAAGDFYREALHLFSRLGHRRGITRILEAMSIVASRMGAPERAMVLSSAAGQLRSTIGLPGPITDEEELTKWIGAARGSLSSVGAEEAERQGAAMTLPEVIRFASA